LSRFNSQTALSIAICECRERSHGDRQYTLYKFHRVKESTLLKFKSTLEDEKQSISVQSECPILDLAKMLSTRCSIASRPLKTLLETPLLQGEGGKSIPVPSSARHRVNFGLSSMLRVTRTLERLFSAGPSIVPSASHIYPRYLRVR